MNASHTAAPRLRWAAAGAALALLGGMPATAQTMSLAADSACRVRAAAAAPAAASVAPVRLWARVPQALRDAGFAVAARQTLDASALGARGQAVRGLVAVDLLVDLEAALGVAGGELFVQHQLLWGENATARLGNALAFSGIDAEPFSGLSEAWIQHQRPGGAVRFKAGVVDGNSEFAVAEHAGGFVNAAMALSPTLHTLPTYPEPAPAVNLFLEPASGWEVAGGAFFARDPGEPGRRSRFLVAEAGRRWGSARSGRLGIGAWRHTPASEAAGGTGGWYAVLDQVAWAAAEAPEQRQVAWFARFGAADPAQVVAGRHLAGGVRGAGLLPLRAAHEVGVGGSWAAERLRAPLAAQLAMEGYVRLAPREWVALQADVQRLRGHVLEPGGAPSAHWVGTLRVVLGR